MFDVQRVEVLKGPQGTLYGRNTTGGAIKVITPQADPSDGWSGYIKGGFGNYSAGKIEGALNMPLIPDKLAARVSLLHNERGGYTEQNIFDPVTKALVDTVDANDKNVESVRLNTVLQATDALSFTLAGDYTENTNIRASSHSDGEIPSATGFTRFSNDIQEVATNFKGDGYARTWGASLTGLYEMDNLDVKVVYAHRKVTSAYAGDVDGTILDLIATIEGDTPAGFEAGKQDSLELQLNGSSFDDRLSWVAGVYFFEEEAVNTFSQRVGTDATGSPDVFLMRLNGANVDNSSQSIYGNATFALTDRLELTAGLRYTEDEKEMDMSNISVTHFGGAPIGESCLFEPPLEGYTPGGQCLVNRSNEYDHISWTIGVNWDVTDSTMIYAKANNGYRAGGQNLRGVNQGTLAPFDEEVVTDIELGIKADLLDRRLRLNAAYFHSFYKDKQESNFVPVGGGGTATAVSNVADADVDGVEAEVTFAVTENLTVDGTFSWTKYNFDDGDLVNPDGSPRRLVPQWAPEWKYSLGATYTVPTSFGDVSARLSYNWRDEYHKTSEKGVIDTVPGATADDQGLVNARVAFNIAEIDTEVAFWVTNLTNEEYIENPLVFSLDGSNYFTNATPGEPRMFGVEARKRF